MHPPPKARLLAHYCLRFGGGHVRSFPTALAGKQSEVVSAPHRQIRNCYRISPWLGFRLAELRVLLQDATLKKKKKSK